MCIRDSDKVEQLKDHGINVVERVPLVVGVGEGNIGYLSTKVDKMGHRISEESLGRK